MNDRTPILTYLPTVFILVLFVLALVGTEGGSSPLAEYETLNKNFAEKMKTIDSRDAYKKLVEEHKAGLKSLREKLDKTTLTNDLELLKGKVLFDLEETDEALKIFESLIRKPSPVPIINQAKFEKVRVYLKQDKYDDALSLFRQVENQVEKNKNYYWVLLEFAMAAKEDKDQEEYSYKFIKAVGNSREYEEYKVMVYENLAKREQEKGNMKKAVEIIEKALPKLNSEEARANLKATLKQMKMVGTPAPELQAETWVNSDALTLNSLKGKAVLIDFWATWCGPCRQVIPVLTKNYNQYKDKGLVVIGFTRLYGGYSDDQGSKGKVPPEEERKLIEGFVKRLQITYPIAIADTKTCFETYGVTGIPTLVFIDKKGKVKDIEVGSGDAAALEKKINALLD